MIRYLLALFRHPSDYPLDPWGFARNQVLHGYLVGGGLTWLAGPLAAVAVYAAWELGQFLFEGASADDCLEDFGFALAVIAAVVLASPWPLAIHLIFLLAGAVKRARRRAALTTDRSE